jgi:hypothetical protein
VQRRAGDEGTLLHVAGEEAHPDQLFADAMRRRLRQRQPGGELGQPQWSALARQESEQPERPSRR